MEFNIVTESLENIKEISLFICAIGFEERSSFIISKLIKEGRVNNQKILCFYFLDNRNTISEHNRKLISAENITLIEIHSNDHLLMIEKIFNRINELPKNAEEQNIHVDYSSMPRNWYANILMKVSKYLDINCRLFFWYSHGDYSSDIEHSSTAGADDFIIFSGKASIKPRERSHVFGLGYDKIKSDAIRSVVDPSTLVVCYTYPQNNIIIRDTIQSENKALFDSSTLSFSLPIEDFSFIVKRIKEVVLDLSAKGDVILIPDGPKPLILACSIIPELINKIGIVCFHVKSHKDNFKPENISPTGYISGFSINN